MAVTSRGQVLCGARRGGLAGWRPILSLLLVAAFSASGALVFPLSRFGAASPFSAGAEWPLLLLVAWPLLGGWALLYALLLRRLASLTWERSLYWAAFCHLPLLLCLALVAAIYGDEDAARAYAFSPLGRQLYQLLARDFVIGAPLVLQASVLAAHRWRTLARGLPLMSLLLLSLALRVSHLAWGLPALLHPDEHRYIGPATIIVARQDLNPHYFENPSLMIYLTSLLFWLARDHALAFRAMDEVFNLGIPDPRGDFVDMVALRGLVAVAGTLTVAVTYPAGRELLGRRAGLFAACLLSVSFLHVRDSHYATNDVVATGFLALSFLFAARVYTRGGKGDYLLAGLFGGLGTSTKYNMGIFAAAVVAAHLARSLDPLRQPRRHEEGTRHQAPGTRRRGDWELGTGDWHRGRFSQSPASSLQSPASTQDSGLSNQNKELSPQSSIPSPGSWPLLLMSGAVSAAAFLAGTPFALLDHESFLAGFRSQLGYGAQVWRGQEAVPSAHAFLAVLVQGYGLIPLALAGLGTLLLVRGDWRKAALLCSVPLTYFLFMSTQKLFFARFALPALPFLALLSGYALDRMGLAVGAHRWRALAATALLLAALLQPLVLSLRHDAVLGRADTRLLATAWINANLPGDSSLAMESYAQLDGKYGWRGHGVRDTWVYWPERKESLAAALSGRYRYVVVSSFGYGLEQKAGDPPSRLPSGYEPLERNGRLVARFAPGIGGVEIPYSLDDMYTPLWHLFDRERPGPTVRIYELGVP